jgi:hypothetical protein
LEKNANPIEQYDENPIVINALDNVVCDVCGEEFNQPLLAELNSGSYIEDYLACPRCLTKVGEVKNEIQVDDADEVEEEEAEEPAKEEAPNVEAGNPEETTNCPYYLGYLKKREKDAPIPEGCFICSKMIDCISARIEA